MMEKNGNTLAPGTSVKRYGQGKVAAAHNIGEVIDVDAEQGLVRVRWPSTGIEWVGFHELERVE